MAMGQEAGDVINVLAKGGPSAMEERLRDIKGVHRRGGKFKDFKTMKGERNIVV